MRQVLHVTYALLVEQCMAAEDPNRALADLEEWLHRPPAASRRSARDLVRQMMTRGSSVQVGG